MQLDHATFTWSGYTLQHNGGIYRERMQQHAARSVCCNADSVQSLFTLLCTQWETHTCDGTGCTVGKAFTT